MRYTDATLDMIPRMQSLVEKEVKEGTILRRSDDELATNIRSYIVAKEGDDIVGYTALHLHSPVLGEVRSLVVDERVRGKGVGKALVLRALEEAAKLGLKEVLVLTYIPEFFERLGFVTIQKETIPDHKIWADCIKCIHFPVCNETALLYRVNRD